MRTPIGITFDRLAAATDSTKMRDEPRLLIRLGVSTAAGQ
jgi:hypothetical protein